MSKEIWIHPELEEIGKLYGAFGVLGKSKLGLKSSKADVYTIKSNEDIENLPKNIPRIFVEFGDWEIIPAENLIAKYREVGKSKKTKIIVKTDDIDKMRVLGKALETGVDGFLLDSKGGLKDFSESYNPIFNLKLVDAEITEIKQIDLGKRACVDCIMSYNQREGALKGWLNDFMFLADGETTENPYVNTREWRVNLGAAGEYVLTRREGIITPRILDDLVSGDEIVVVNADGIARVETIGRVKKEWRPMTFIKAIYEENGKKKEGKTCSQNAETVRLVTPDGSKDVTELKVGDLLKAYISKPVATHFGRPVDEMIVEV